MIAGLMSGCAYTYVDSKGGKHIVGLVDIKIEPGEKEGQLGGQSVEVNSIGMSIYSTPMNSGFALGYNREFIMDIHNNSCLYIKNENP